MIRAPSSPQAERVLVKLEMQNPGGSLKDRIALSMIETAEKEGKIKPGVTTLCDFTSGNTGVHLPQSSALSPASLCKPHIRLPPACWTHRALVGFCRDRGGHDCGSQGVQVHHRNATGAHAL